MSDFYKKLLEDMSNFMFEDEIDLLYGAGSKIKINHCYWSTSKKMYVIDATLTVTLIQEAVDAFPMGLEYIIEESWRFLGVPHGIIILSSIT